MGFEVRFSGRAETDLTLIFDHLFHSYRSFCEPPDEAIDHAEVRVAQIRRDAERLALNPYRGTRRDDIGPGLRHVSIGRATYWFQIDEAGRTVRVVGVFFGGQDHERRVLLRLLSE